MVVGRGLLESGSGVVFGTSTSFPSTLTLILSTAGACFVWLVVPLDMWLSLMAEWLLPWMAGLHLFTAFLWNHSASPPDLSASQKMYRQLSSSRIDGSANPALRSNSVKKFAPNF